MGEAVSKVFFMSKSTTILVEVYVVLEEFMFKTKWPIHDMCKAHEESIYEKSS